MVKETVSLQAAVERRDNAALALKEAMTQWERDGSLPEGRPSFFSIRYPGKRTDTIDYYNKLVLAGEEQIREERRKIQEASSTLAGINATTGFVTFHCRSEAEVAMCLEFSSNEEEWVVSLPPGPDSVRR